MVRARPHRSFLGTYSKPPRRETFRTHVLGSQSSWIHHRPVEISTLFKPVAPEMPGSLDTSALLPRLPLLPMANEALKHSLAPPFLEDTP